jgi:hypothetical protein
MRRLGEDLAQCSPEPERTVADGHNRSGHSSALHVPQYVGPGLGGLAVAVGDRDQLLGPVGPDTHDDQGTQAYLFQPHVEVDPVDVDVDVVDLLQRPVDKTVPFLLPVGSQPGDHRGGQTGGRPKELLQGGHEVT